MKCVVYWTDSGTRFVLLSDGQRLESAPVNKKSLYVLGSVLVYLS